MTFNANTELNSRSTMAVQEFRLGDFSYFCTADTILASDGTIFRHMVVNERTNDTLLVNFSSNKQMNILDVARWIDLGCPERNGDQAITGIWTSRGLELAWIASKHVGPTYPEQFFIGTPPPPRRFNALVKLFVSLVAAGAATAFMVSLQP